MKVRLNGTYWRNVLENVANVLFCAGIVFVVLSIVLIIVKVGVNLNNITNTKIVIDYYCTQMADYQDDDEIKILEKVISSEKISDYVWKFWHLRWSYTIQDKKLYDTMMRLYNDRYIPDSSFEARIYTLTNT